jgi:uncharacterized membrane protein YraQ (UPF0718 family)
VKSLALDGVWKLIWGSLSPIEKGMIIFTLTLYLFSTIYGPSTREKTIEGLMTGSKTTIRVSLLIISGIFLGSLMGAYLPSKLVAGLLGAESGIRGMLLGTVLGAVMPGGPYVLFPTVSALYTSGAAVQPMVSMIISWSCIALTRIPLELGYLSLVGGQRLVWLRLLVGIPLPILAGFLAGLLSRSG